MDVQTQNWQYLNDKANAKIPPFGIGFLASDAKSQASCMNDIEHEFFATTQANNLQKRMQGRRFGHLQESRDGAITLLRKKRGVATRFSTLVTRGDDQKATHQSSRSTRPGRIPCFPIHISPP